MVARKRALSRASPPSKLTLLRSSIASALAAGALTCAVGADARVVSVQLSAPTIAFGERTRRWSRESIERFLANGTH